ncbi:hypothetical protein JCM24511_10210 [Saitozyma sp. JCM 24511]|nr:hypothetical protein JCM24511_10210 [Saitozyma sp. JCM 24511]
MAQLTQSNSWGCSRLHNRRTPARLQQQTAPVPGQTPGHTANAADRRRPTHPAGRSILAESLGYVSPVDGIERIAEVEQGEGVLQSTFDSPYYRLDHSFAADTNWYDSRKSRRLECRMMALVASL